MIRSFLHLLFVVIVCVSASVTWSEPETPKTKRCPDCGQIYTEDIKFCGKDGVELLAVEAELICPKCGQRGEPGETFCRNDGAKLEPAQAEKPRAAPEELTKEQLKETAKNRTEKADQLIEEAYFEDALNELLGVLELDPSDPSVHYKLGGVYWQLGDKKSALKHLDECLKLIPYENTEARQRIEGYVAKLEEAEVGLRPREKEKRLQDKEERKSEIMNKALEENRSKWEEMVVVPAGIFVMGSNFRDEMSENARLEETPQREVYLDAFYIDKYEVTNAQYWAFLKHIRETGDHSKCYPGEPKDKDHTPDKWYEDRYFDHADFPVIRIDWYDAWAYAAWAGKRLPTEAEWEKAARGTDGRRFPWGDVFSASRVNWGATGPLTVGSYEDGKSVFGCHDMAGSVMEWCSDWFDRYYYKRGPTSNPKGPEKSTGVRSMRGGSLFANSAYLLRCTKRSFARPDERNRAIGFRCVADAG